MYIKRYCMNLVYFDQHFHTINYTEILHFAIFVFQRFACHPRLSYFNNSNCLRNSLFFIIRKYFTYYEGEKVMTSYR